jgi:hypothetical protein
LEEQEEEGNQRLHSEVCCGSSRIWAVFRIRDPVPFWTPGIRNRFFPDPKPIFLRAQWQYFGSKVLWFFVIWLKFVSSIVQK